jgi:excisionase family DNA binding protein
MSRPDLRVARLLYKPEDAAELLSIGRTLMYDLIKSGQVDSVKVGRRRLVPAEALTSYVDHLRAVSA